MFMNIQWIFMNIHENPDHQRGRWPRKICIHPYRTTPKNKKITLGLQKLSILENRVSTAALQLYALLSCLPSM